MSAEPIDNDLDIAEKIAHRAQQRDERYTQRVITMADKLFAAVFIAEWLFGIAISIIWSPYTWAGKTRIVNLHIWLAIGLGAAIVSMPLALIWKKSGATVTRYTVAFAQMLFSALLIHLSGGRIETHFHVFGSLALLGFYFDWKVMIIAAATVALDHFVRGLLYPESVYGIANPEWWRFLEHAFWVVLFVAAIIGFCTFIKRLRNEDAEETGFIEATLERERRKSAALERELAASKGM